MYLQPGATGSDVCQHAAVPLHICQAEQRTNRLFLSAMYQNFHLGWLTSNKTKKWQKIENIKWFGWVACAWYVTANMMKGEQKWLSILNYDSLWISIFDLKRDEHLADNIGCRHISAATSTVMPWLCLAEALHRVGSECKGLFVGRGVWLACNRVWPLAGPWLMQVWASEWIEVSAQWHMTCHG